jgi:hypothetical protein
MPKVVPQDKKQFQCDFCSKCYAHAPSKYAHERSKHPELKREARVSKIMNVSNEPTIDIDAQVKKLKMQVMDGKLTLEDFISTKKELEEKVTKQRQTDTRELVLKLDLFLSDKDYALDYLTNTISDISVIEEQIISGEIAAVFVKVFIGQIHIFRSKFDELCIQYLTDDGLSEEIEFTNSFCRKMISGIINCLAFKYQRNYNGDIVQKYPEHSLEHITEVSKVERSGKLMFATPARDDLTYYKLIVSKTDKWFGKPLQLQTKAKVQVQVKRKA